MGELIKNAESCVQFDDFLCLKLGDEVENNLVCVTPDGKVRWTGEDLYKKNSHAKLITQVGPNLLKVVWANNDIKVINALKGEIRS